VIFILLATVLFGIGDALWKPILEKHEMILAIRARTIITTSVLILIAVLLGKHELGRFSDYLSAIFPSFLSATAFIFLIKAFKHSSVSVVITMNSLSLIVSQIVAFILFKETINPVHYSFVLVGIITSIVLLNSGEFKISKGIKYAIVSSILFGIAYPLLSIPSVTIGNFQTSAIQEIVLLVVILSIFKTSRQNPPSILALIRTPSIILVALFVAVGLSLLFYSYTIMPVYKAHLISSFVPIPALIFARIVYKEKLHSIQKVGVAISLGCTFLIVTEFI
jgi:drug/metabolite transporter (DMT)-like permease